MSECHRPIRSAARAHSTVLLALCLGACTTTVASVTPGVTWVVGHTTHLSRLTIPPGGRIAALAGSDLTLTVNGIDTAITPGTYTGDVVLSVTGNNLVPYPGLAPHHFRQALYVENGAIVPEKSVTSALIGGTYDNTHARDISITSHDENFNGIVVTGNSTYTIDRPRIIFIGNGGNDFAGFGAAIMSSGHARLTINHADITTYGVVRTAVFVAGNSDTTVNDSTIDVHNGTLPADYTFTLDLGKMKEVPWMLGLSGNARATNLVDNGTVHYNNSHIRVQGWGALSVDAAAHTRLTATNCLIETVDSGYGAYSIGDSVDTFRHDVFNVADMALILAAQGSAVFTDGTIVNSRRFGVVAHSGTGGGTLTIAKGAVFNTKSTAILLKGRGDTIVVDHATLNPGNGIILEAMVNDDPMASSTGGPIVGVKVAAPATVAPDSDVHAWFSNVALHGDIINALTSKSAMSVTLTNATLSGAISTAVAGPASGRAPTRETYKSIGDVANRLTATHDPHGLIVSLRSHSKWIVTKTSFLTGLSLASSSAVTAPKGERISFTVNGVKTLLAAGSYSGNLTLSVSPQCDARASPASRASDSARACPAVHRPSQPPKTARYPR